MHPPSEADGLAIVTVKPLLAGAVARVVIDPTRVTGVRYTGSAALATGVIVAKLKAAKAARIGSVIEILHESSGRVSASDGRVVIPIEDKG